MAQGLLNQSKINIRTIKLSCHKCSKLKTTPKKCVAPYPQLRYTLLCNATSIDVSTPKEEISEAQFHEQEPSTSVPSQDNKKRLWMAAIKPPMYSVGFIPVLVAASAVFYQLGVFPGMPCAGFVLASILIIGWLNLSNDAFDATTGVDVSKPESVVNLTGNRNGVLLLSKVLLLCGVLLLGNLIRASGSSLPAVMLAAAIACGYVYQGPPFRLSYKGLGEPLCFTAFGPLAISAFYLAMLLPLLGACSSPAAAAAAVQPALASPLLPPVPALVHFLALINGVTTTVILFCSHFHQIEGDRSVGKMSPLVRLGTSRGLQVLRVSTLLPYLLCGAGIVTGALPRTLALTIMLTLPAALELIRFAESNHTVPAAIAPLKRYAVKWHITTGLAVMLGLCTGRLLM